MELNLSDQTGSTEGGEEITPGGVGARASASQVCEPTGLALASIVNAMRVPALIHRRARRGACRASRRFNDLRLEMTSRSRANGLGPIVGPLRRQCVKPPSRCHDEIGRASCREGVADWVA